MPYYVQKSGKSSWWLTWRSGDQSRQVPKDSPEARTAGFRPEMTFLEARQRSKQIQAEAWVELEAARALRSKVILDKYAMLRGAFLTDADAEGFERHYLPEYKIRRAHWNLMQRIIVDIGIHPSDWFEQKSLVYKQFQSKKCSANYAKKILRYLNLWGYYLCKKQNKPFLKVPGFDGIWKNKLEVARRPGGASLPLSPELLEQKRSVINEANYRWLFVTVWFGLRPREVDNLTKDKEHTHWAITEDINHEFVLSVFQEKLFERGVAKDDCWKHIPTVFPEQKIAIGFIQQGILDKPIGFGGKFMSRTFGPGYSHYAGRNNFSGLLRENGYDLEPRKHWMGHLSVTTTEAYDRKTQRSKVFFKAPVKKTG